MSKSRVKAMLIIIFDVKWMVIYEFVRDRQTVNSAFYLKGERRLKRRVNWVRPAIAGNWNVHPDNAPSHTCCKSQIK